MEKLKHGQKAEGLPSNLFSCAASGDPRHCAFCHLWVTLPSTWPPSLLLNSPPLLGPWRPTLQPQGHLSSASTDPSLSPPRVDAQLPHIVLSSFSPQPEEDLIIWTLSRKAPHWEHQSVLSCLIPWWVGEATVAPLLFY